MARLLKEALSLWIIKTRIDVLNQAFYAAVAYAHECTASGDDSDPDDLALDYVAILLPKIDRGEAYKHLLAMRSRLAGVGSRPELKL